MVHMTFNSIMTKYIIIDKIHYNWQLIYHNNSVATWTMSGKDWLPCQLEVRVPETLSLLQFLGRLEGLTILAGANAM